MNRRVTLFVLGLVLAGRCWSLATGNCDEPPAELLPRAAQIGDPVDPITGRGDSDDPLPTKPIGSLTTNVQSPHGDLPEDIAAKHFAHDATIDGNAGRNFGETLYFWQASNLAHRPLYFEQAYVERYGYNYGLLQPVVSAADFYGDFALLPIKMIVHPPRQRIYTLGTARPGTPGTRFPRW